MEIHITTSKLRELEACSDGINWFLAQRETEIEPLCAALIADELRLVNRLMAEELARRAPPDSTAWGVKEWKMHAARCDAALDDASERLATIAASVDLRPLRE